MVPGSKYGYQAAAVDGLKSFEQTIATGLFDESGSTRPFARQMELCVQEIIRSQRHNPVADKLMYRHCHFDTKFREVHGYKPLPECLDSDYDGCWAGGGQTALYNSLCEVLEAKADYAERLAGKRFIVNGFLYLLTDGLNYLPGQISKTKDDVKLTLAKVVASESLESLVTIMIGINEDKGVLRDLEEFSRYIGFSQFEKISEANEQTLARVCNFISRSLQSQSQHVGSGGPSQSLTF